MIFDAHSDFGLFVFKEHLRNNFGVLSQDHYSQLITANVSVEVLTVGGDFSFWGIDFSRKETVLKTISAVKKEIEMSDGKFFLIESKSDFKNLKTGSIGIIIALEGAMPFFGTENSLGEFYSNGLRSIILTTNSENPFSGGCSTPQIGLSKTGKELLKLIEKMRGRPFRGHGHKEKEKNVNNVRKHGKKPYKIAVIHGGPGALGEMQPIASFLSSYWGILEPFQTETTIEKQIIELREILEDNEEKSFVLIGFSWGAWLSYIFTARFPTLVKKLILIGSGPYKQEYVKSFEQTRLSRLSTEEKQEWQLIIRNLSDLSFKNRNQVFMRLGELSSKTDSFDPLKDEYDEPEIVKVKDLDFSGVLNEALELRRKDELIRFSKQIICPVVAIHGSYDPHPAEGVKIPLSNTINDFQFYLIDECGHKPWIERKAKDEFYKILKEII